MMSKATYLSTDVCEDLNFKHFRMKTNCSSDHLILPMNAAPQGLPLTNQQLNQIYLCSEKKLLLLLNNR